MLLYPLCCPAAAHCVHARTDRSATTSWKVSALAIVLFVAFLRGKLRMEINLLRRWENMESGGKLSIKTSGRGIERLIMISFNAVGRGWSSRILITCTDGNFNVYSVQLQAVHSLISPVTGFDCTCQCRLCCRWMLLIKRENVHR